jgi:hypothetical protein
MLIKVLKKEGPFVSAKGYQTLDITYDVDGKSKTQKLVDFGESKEVFNILREATADSVYDIKLKKNGNFWNWVGAVLQKTEMSSSTKAAPTSATRSTFESPEERAQKQVYIIRQSSLANACTILTCGAKSPPKQEDVIALADVLVSYVLNGNSAGSKLPELHDDTIDWPK